MNHRNYLNVAGIIARILENGGITLHRENAVDFVEVTGPGIVVGLCNDFQQIDSELQLSAAVTEKLFGANLTANIGFWLEPTQPEYRGEWPRKLHTDAVAIIPDRTAAQVAYACALGVQYRQESLYHFESGVCVPIRPSAEYRKGDTGAVWYDAMIVGPESLIAIHADSHLSFPGSPLPTTSCSLFRGYRGEVEPIPLGDNEFTQWYRESVATPYFKNRASDRQSQTRRIACRKLGAE